MKLTLYKCCICEKLKEEDHSFAVVISSVNGEVEHIKIMHPKESETVHMCHYCYGMLERALKS